MHNLVDEAHDVSTIRQQLHNYRYDDLLESVPGNEGNRKYISTPEIRRASYHTSYSNKEGRSQRRGSGCRRNCCRRRVFGVQVFISGIHHLFSGASQFRGSDHSGKSSGAADSSAQQKRDSSQSRTANHLVMLGNSRSAAAVLDLSYWYSRQDGLKTTSDRYRTACSVPNRAHRGVATIHTSIELCGMLFPWKAELSLKRPTPYILRRLCRMTQLDNVLAGNPSRVCRYMELSVYLLMCLMCL